MYISPLFLAMAMSNVAIQSAIHTHVYSCVLIFFCVYNAPAYARNPPSMSDFIRLKFFFHELSRLPAAAIATCDSPIDSRYTRYNPYERRENYWQSTSVHFMNVAKLLIFLFLSFYYHWLFIAIREIFNFNVILKLMYMS